MLVFKRKDDEVVVVGNPHSPGAEIKIIEPRTDQAWLDVTPPRNMAADWKEIDFQKQTEKQAQQERLGPKSFGPGYFLSVFR